MVTKNLRNQKLLSKILLMLKDVSYKKIEPYHFDNIKINRLNKDYEPILSLCKIFIEKKLQGFEGGKNEIFSFLFNMNSLFETFVFNFLRRYSHMISVNDGKISKIEDQKNLGKIFDEISMKVDGLIYYQNEKNERKRLLVDTKYKILDPEKTHKGLSVSDLYQMFAYARVPKNKTEDIILLYPKHLKQRRISDKLSQAISINDSSVNIHVKTLNLEQAYNKEKNMIKKESLIQQFQGKILKFN